MRSAEILEQLHQVATVKDLTTAFESIASLRIARIKDRVSSSEEFFHELWQIYTMLRVDVSEGLTTWAVHSSSDKPNAYLVLTSEARLSGDIDERIIREVVKQYDQKTTDLFVVGAHGASLLDQRGIRPKQSFNLPEADQLVDVRPITAELLRYKHPTAFYQSYRSLAVQEVARIDLLAHVQTLAREKRKLKDEVISAAEYVFEPGVREVVQYLESVMLGIATNQLILESRLAQYASRFSAMYAASQAAGKLTTQVERRYRSAKRNESDERAKEIVNAMAVKQ